MSAAFNPIADHLGLVPALDKHLLTIDGRRYELYPARGQALETLYRLDTAFGVPNPGFSLVYRDTRLGKIALGRHLARHRSHRLKDAQALAAVDAARAELAEAVQTLAERQE